MDLGQYYGKSVRIVCDEGKIFEGFITLYVYPEDNDPEVEGIIMDHKPSASLIEFRETDIKTITVID